MLLHGKLITGPVSRKDFIKVYDQLNAIQDIAGKR